MLKWTRKDGTCNGGTKPYQYSLPRGAILGSWHEIPSGRVEACSSGFHGSSLQYIHDYSGYGTRLWLVEVDGKYDTDRTKYSPLEDANKVAVEKIRFYYKFDIPTELLKNWTYVYSNNYIGSVSYEKLRQEIVDYILSNYELPIGTVDTISKESSVNRGNLKKMTFAEKYAPGSF
jgi:hypothetical protein